MNLVYDRNEAMITATYSDPSTTSCVQYLGVVHDIAIELTDPAVAFWRDSGLPRRILRRFVTAGLQMGIDAEGARVVFKWSPNVMNSKAWIHAMRCELDPSAARLAVALQIFFVDVFTAVDCRLFELGVLKDDEHLLSKIHHEVQP